MTSTHSDKIVRTDTGDTGSAKLRNFRISDNRPEAVLQRKEMESIRNSSHITAQQQENDTSAIANNTGMPDHLKNGLEQLSGFDLSDVTVHYNSPKPSAIGALAYAKGNEIHLGPGQEKHLPHEGWHVVQQMQGRVKANASIQGHHVNDSPHLENEASEMGMKAECSSGIENTVLRVNGNAGNICPVAQLQVKVTHLQGQGKTTLFWKKKLFAITSGRPDWTAEFKQAFYQYVQDRNPEFADTAMNPDGSMKQGWQRGHLTAWNIIRDAFVESTLNGKTREEWRRILKDEKNLKSLTQENIDGAIETYIIEKVGQRFNSIEEENLKNLWPTKKVNDQDRGNRADIASTDASDILGILKGHKLNPEDIRQMEKDNKEYDLFGGIYKWIKLNFFRLEDQNYAENHFTEKEIIEQKLYHIEQTMAAYKRRYGGIEGFTDALQQWAGIERLRELNEIEEAAEKRAKAKEEKKEKQKESKRQVQAEKEAQEKAKKIMKEAERNRKQQVQKTKNTVIIIVGLLVALGAALVYQYLK